MTPQELLAKGIASMKELAPGLTELHQSWEQYKEKGCIYDAIVGKPFTYTDDCLAEFRAWCAANSVHYYGAPREDFSMSEAIREAQKAGTAYLMVEDMS